MKKFGYVLTAPDLAASRIIGNLLGIAARYSSKVSVRSEDKTVPLADILKKRTLDLSCGKKVMVTVEGRDEEAAVAALQNYFVACM